MAPAPPTTTWTHLHRPFLRPLALVLATKAFRPASSQLIFTPPTAGATFAGALTPPPPPTDGGLGGGTFNVATSILFVGVIVALFLVGFLSAYLRRCADAATAAHRGGDANAAVAAAAAAAFSSPSANRGSRRRGAAAGLGTAAMEALPVLTYARARAVKAGRGALECAVCLAEFTDDGEKLRLLPGCCHVFHAACIDVWLAAHATCPVCRADLADPAIAAAGRVLSADLAADHVELETASADHTVVDVETTASTPRGQEEEEITAEERADRYTLRLPERLRREIEDAKRLRRAVSAVTAASVSSSSGRWGLPSALRTMSAARPSRRWSALFRALSGPHRSDLDGRVAPLQVQTHPASTRDNVEVVVVRRGDDVGTETEKHYAHSLTFAGFVIDGDVASGDWNPEVFQVSSAVLAPAPSQP